MNLVLIARKAELLNQIADDIRTQYGVQVEVIIADFGIGASIYNDIAIQFPTTVIEAGPCYVSQIKTYKNGWIPTAYIQK